MGFDLILSGGALQENIYDQGCNDYDGDLHSGAHHD